MSTLLSYGDSRMGKLIFVIWATIQTFFVIGCAFGQDEPVSVETIERIKSAVVPVICGTLNNNNKLEVKKIMATGFFVNNEGHFLTAAHVLDYWEKSDEIRIKCFPAIYIFVGGWQAKIGNARYSRFDTCIKSNSIDIALCKPIENPFLDEAVKQRIDIVSFGNFNNLKDGTPVAFTGFPLDLLKPLTSKGNIASFIETDNRIVIDKSAWPGASGSPVYLSDGKVIGI